MLSICLLYLTARLLLLPIPRAGRVLEAGSLLGFSAAISAWLTASHPSSEVKIWRRRRRGGMVAEATAATAAAVKSRVRAAAATGSRATLLCLLPSFSSCALLPESLAYMDAAWLRQQPAL